jgi:Haem-degrading
MSAQDNHRSDTCKNQDYRVSVTVVGRNGEPLVQLRGEDASPHTYDFSFRKAYTARTFRVASGEIANRFKQDPAYFAVHVPNAVPSQGALPIKLGEESSVRSAYPALRAARRTRPAPNPASTRPPTSSNRSSARRVGAKAFVADFEPLDLFDAGRGRSSTTSPL